VRGFAATLAAAATVVVASGTGLPISTTHTLVGAVLGVGIARGIAAINHPNYTWAFDHEAISEVRGAHLLEVFNGHPRVNVHGAGGRPGYEEIWDRVLSTGLPIWGVATDDSHQFKGQFGPHRVNPGRGWVMVRAPELEVDSIVDAMRAGDFYASTGVVLEKLEWGPEGIRLNICPDGDALYTTRFIGTDGAVLKEVFGPEAEYEARGDEAYFRASVLSSAGSRAWTQPMFAR